MACTIVGRVGPVVAPLCAFAQCCLLRRQPVTVAAEGVGLDDAGAGRDVGAVNLLHQCGLRKIQLIEAAGKSNPSGIEHGAHGAHGAVAQDQPALQTVKEGVLPGSFPLPVYDKTGAIIPDASMVG